jgi:hypothetical protein
MLKAPNIFELFSIFVAAFFPRNVSRVDGWPGMARASRADCSYSIGFALDRGRCDEPDY